MIAVSPSRMSSPETRSSGFFISPHSKPQLLTRVVSAARKPSSWVPPSWVLMVLAKVCTDSLKVVFHCIATSRLMWFSTVSGLSASNEMIVGLAACLRRLRCST